MAGLKKNNRQIKSRKGKRGYPAFVPTDDQRRMVEQLSGLRVTWEELRKIIFNPLTNKPIARTSFSRIFARELAEGRARLKALIGRRYFEALDAGEPWAIRLGLRNNLNWVFEGSQPLPLLADDGGLPRDLNIRFVLPDRARRRLM